jgi:hypothetical protein
MQLYDVQKKKPAKKLVDGKRKAAMEKRCKYHTPSSLGAGEYLAIFTSALDCDNKPMSLLLHTDVPHVLAFFLLYVSAGALSFFFPMVLGQELFNRANRARKILASKWQRVQGRGKRNSGKGMGGEVIHALPLPFDLSLPCIHDD